MARVHAFRAADSALGNEAAFQLYLRGAELVGAIDDYMAERRGPDDVYERDVRPWLDALEYVAAGVSADEDVVVRRIVIGG